MSDIEQSADRIERLLLEVGWPLTRITKDTWSGRFRTRERTFPIVARVHPAGYFICAIVPYAPSPSGPAAEPLYERLLQLNHVMSMAKFSIDDDLDVLLTVEYPTAHIDESEIRDVFDHLAYYADNHFDEIAEISSKAIALEEAERNEEDRVTGEWDENEWIHDEEE